MSQKYFDTRYALPLAAWALLIVVLSSIPGRSLPEVDLFSIDKVGHFLVFSVLGYLSIRWFYVNRDRPGILFRYYFYASLASAFIFAGLDEIHQLFVPNRACSIFDFTADVLGIALAHVVFVKVFVKRQIRIFL